VDWKEVDKLLNEMFNAFIQKKMEKKAELSSKNEVSRATEEFIYWLDSYVKTFDDEIQKMEEFQQKRMVCAICKERIVDDSYLVVPHPYFPNDYTKALYFHSKGKCDPRWRAIKSVRERWLREHTKNHH
jgi:hypothetical protein